MRAPKQWSLTKHETITSFESWRQSLTYTLSLDPHFATFMTEGFVWGKKTNAAPLRGFANDRDNVAEARCLTAAQKVVFLELMLGQIATFCPVISKNTIVKNSTSITGIWQAICQHYWLQSCGSHLLDFADLKLEPDERPKDLYQRIMAFVEDNLLKNGGGITHHNNAADTDEDMSPSLENIVVVTWLRLINVGLPRLVKQRYGTELRASTLASTKPEISQALSSLMDELHTSEDAEVLRAATQSSRFRPPSAKPNGNRYERPLAKTCPLCKQAGRPNFS